MTVGKDVSMLFTDVVNCIQTGTIVSLTLGQCPVKERLIASVCVCLRFIADTQLKKLVYLYLINYAKSNPDLTILAVNTFVKVRTAAVLI